MPVEIIVFLEMKNFEMNNTIEVTVLQWNKQNENDFILFYKQFMHFGFLFSVIVELQIFTIRHCDYIQIVVNKKKKRPFSAAICLTS